MTFDWFSQTQLRDFDSRMDQVGISTLLIGRSCRGAVEMFSRSSCAYWRGLPLFPSGQSRRDGLGDETRRHRLDIKPTTHLNKIGYQLFVSCVLTAFGRKRSMESFQIGDFGQ